MIFVVIGESPAWANRVEINRVSKWDRVVLIERCRHKKSPQSIAGFGKLVEWLRLAYFLRLMKLISSRLVRVLLVVLA
jgi:hypothetical protein